MKLYLDDDIASTLLTALLRRAGHDVQIPADVGMVGKRDPAHLTYAVRQGRTIVSYNYKDYDPLHDLVMAVQGHHPGIFVVRRDNDPRRNLNAGDIVRAIANLLASGVPIPDGYHILNHWR
jgi:predicted nuclease of predicted toxin-antitoxin system